MSEDGPIWHKPTNQEWAETKAWTRQFMARHRELERLAQREWTEEVRQRLGLVTEVHRCRAWKCGPGDWGWFCLRPFCGEVGHFLPSQAKAVGAAQEHTRAFVPEPPEKAPTAGLDWDGYVPLIDAVPWRGARW